MKYCVFTQIDLIHLLAARSGQPAANLQFTVPQGASISNQKREQMAKEFAANFQFTASQGASISHQNRDQTAKEFAVCTIGIDFGTSRTGYGFAFKDNKGKNVCSSNNVKGN